MKTNETIEQKVTKAEKIFPGIKKALTYEKFNPEWNSAYRQLFSDIESASTELYDIVAANAIEVYSTPNTEKVERKIILTYKNKEGTISGRLETESHIIKSNKPGFKPQDGVNYSYVQIKPIGEHEFELCMVNDENTQGLKYHIDLGNSYRIC